MIKNLFSLGRKRTANIEETCTGDSGCNVKKKKKCPTYKISIPPGSVLRKQQLVLLGKELSQQSNVMNTVMCKAKTVSLASDYIGCLLANGKHFNKVIWLKNVFLASSTHFIH